MRYEGDLQRICRKLPVSATARKTCETRFMIIPSTRDWRDLHTVSFATSRQGLERSRALRAQARHPNALHRLEKCTQHYDLS